ncbi:AAA family ATPase [Aquiflexum sp. LQ15W]|uniref:ATP-binding protein n=1 Tax=Cognataquiflexum nitidum TaxID=2922272 RepID=UPI001F128E1B|nr:AAA family ATPase [Cognataquiflexum nitidum]MCH6201906.1 AAA family ATPase [Cognataquiflexum nitidum]
MYFQRDLEKDLLLWKNRKNRKPLLLKGARQVGKTSLIKTFGKREFEDVAYFNFDEQPDIKQFFESTKDVTRLLQNLSLVHGKNIQPEKTLIIFDEIQECKPALNSLKYFNENAPEYVIIAAGSLLGITLGNEASFPVGKVEFMEAFPLTYLEFLHQADPNLAAYVKSAELGEPIPDFFFNSLLEKFKLYFISGGLPEAAKILLDEMDIDRTQQILQDIQKAYELDFSKHTEKKDIPKISYIWDSIPSQLAKENKKFLYQAVKTGARAREYEDALLWLVQAGLVHKIHRCTQIHLPLTAYDDLSAFKIYLFDTGLLRRKSQLDPMAFKEGNRLFVEFKGALTENFILQSLMPQLDVLPRYWTSEGKAEVDFLIQFRNEIIPIEVKSDENVRSKSLAYYSQVHSPKLKIRYSLKNMEFRDGLLNIPLFLVDRTKDYLEKIFVE